MAAAPQIYRFVLFSSNRNPILLLFNVQSYGFSLLEFIYFQESEIFWGASTWRGNTGKKIPEKKQTRNRILTVKRWIIASRTAGRFLYDGLYFENLNKDRKDASVQRLIWNIWQMTVNNCHLSFCRICNLHSLLLFLFHVVRLWLRYTF